MSTQARKKQALESAMSYLGQSKSVWKRELKEVESDIYDLASALDGLKEDLEECKNAIALWELVELNT